MVSTHISTSPARTTSARVAPPGESNTTASPEANTPVEDSSEGLLVDLGFDCRTSSPSLLDYLAEFDSSNHQIATTQLLPNSGNVLYAHDALSLLEVIKRAYPEQSFEEIVAAITQELKQGGFRAPRALLRDLLLPGLRQRKDQKFMIAEQEVDVYKLGSDISFFGEAKAKHKLSGYSQDGQEMLALADICHLGAGRAMSIIVGDYHNIGGLNRFYETLLRKTNPSHEDRYYEIESKKYADKVARHLADYVKQETEAFAEERGIKPEQLGFCALSGGDEIAIVSELGLSLAEELVSKLDTEIGKKVQDMGLDRIPHTKEKSHGELKEPGFGIRFGVESFDAISPKENRENILTRAEQNSQDHAGPDEREAIDINAINTFDATQILESVDELPSTDNIDPKNIISQLKAPEKLRLFAPIYPQMAALLRLLNSEFEHVDPDNKRSLLALAQYEMKYDTAKLQRPYYLLEYMRSYAEDSKTLSRQYPEAVAARVMVLGIEGLTMLNDVVFKNHHEATNAVLRYMTSIIKEVYETDTGLERYRGAIFGIKGGKIIQLIPSQVNIPVKAPDNGGITVSLDVHGMNALCDYLQARIKERITELNDFTVNELIDRVSKHEGREIIDKSKLTHELLETRIGSIANPRKQDSLAEEMGISARSIVQEIKDPDLTLDEEYLRQTERLFAEIERMKQKDLAAV
jgi:GGDEF domain-containing protein